MTPEQRNAKAAGSCIPGQGDSLESHLWWWQTFYPNSKMIENIKEHIEMMKRIEARNAE